MELVFYLSDRKSNFPLNEFTERLCGGHFVLVLQTMSKWKSFSTLFSKIMNYKIQRRIIQGLLLSFSTKTPFTSKNSIQLLYIQKL